MVQFTRLTASSSISQFFNTDLAVQHIAVWNLNITTPRIDPNTHQPEETNWHEAYRCNDIDQDGLILSERPWFMRWWSGIPAGSSFTPCYRVFLPVGSNNYTTELIKNGNFDASGAYWNATTSQTSCRYPDNYPYPIFDVLDGNNAARMGRCPSNTDTLSQTITIPSNVTNAQLTFQFRVEQSYSEPHYYDGLYIKIWDRNTSELVQLTSYTDSPPRYVWRASSTLDLTARRGHTLDVILSATNNSDLWPTKFWIDDVSVQIVY